MSIVNKVRRVASSSGSSAARSHLNFMGGVSFDINNPLVRLRLAASSCFFGEPMYYHRDKGAVPVKRKARPSALTKDQLAHLRATLHAIDPADWRALSPAELMERAIDEALTHDAEATLAEAVRLRNVEHMRVTPQVILVRAANHPAVRGTGLVRASAPAIVKRADEPSTGLAYQLARFGRPIPNALKRAWADALQNMTSYDLAKYRLEAREVKTVDVINLVHPKSEPVDALVRGTLRTTDRTWESIISAQGSNADAWRSALEVMGHMALLRNVRNFLEAGLAPNEFLPKLVDTAKHGKQLPFRYYSAYCAVKDKKSPRVLDAIETCLKRSLGELPWFRGRTMSLCDNSGSARGSTTSSMGTMRVATIANLTGLLAGMRSDDGYVGVFGDRLDRVATRTNASVFDQLDALETSGESVGGATENGVWLFWDQAIRKKEHWDNVFVFSDMQAGHGGLYGTNPKQYARFAWNERYIDVAQLVSAYRAEVNPSVRVYLVQVAGYQDTLIPEFYDRTYILGGWGEGLLRFAAEMTELNP